MSDAIATFGAFIFFASVVGVIYPYKPFKKRRNALGVLVATLFFVGIFAESPDKEQSKSNGEEPNTVATKAPAKATEVSVAKDPSKLDEVETAKKPVDLAQDVTQSPSETEISTVRQSFENHNWGLTASQFRRFETRGDQYEDLAAEIENRTLTIVRPLPASDFDGNLEGYKLLVAIRPENESYAAKVKDYTARRDQARQASVTKLRKKVDRVEGVTFYEHPNTPKYVNSRSTVYLYIGRQGESGKPWLRMKTIYASSDWLFVDKVIAWHDGIRESLVSGDFDRDNNTSIWEWRDEIPTDNQIEVLRSLANAREAILRYEGMQYRKDVTLSSGDKRAIREVLQAYDVMRLDWLK